MTKHQPERFKRWTDVYDKVAFGIGLAATVVVGAFGLWTWNQDILMAAAGLFLPSLLGPIITSSIAQRRFAVGNCWNCGGPIVESDGPTEHRCDHCYWDMPDKIVLR